MLTSKQRLYALHVSPQRFSYSSAFAFSFACLSSSSLSSVSEVFVLLGCDTAAAANGLLEEVDATGGTDGAARRRYSSNQWLKHESYVRFRGVHGACSESIVHYLCLGRRATCATLSLVPVAHSKSRKVWHSSPNTRPQCRPLRALSRRRSRKQPRPPPSSRVFMRDSCAAESGQGCRSN